MQEKRYLSVRSKVLLVIAASIVVLLAFMYAMADEVLTHSYMAIEHDDVVQNLDRATDAVNDFEENWFINLQDWSPWSDLYDYTVTRDPVFEKETLFPEGFARQDQNGFLLSDTTGKFFLAHIVDIETETEVSSSTVVTFLEGHPDLVTHTTPENFTKGLVMIGNQPTVVVSKPVLKNDNTGPINASVTIIRFLDDQKVQDIAEVTHLAIQVFHYDDPALPQDVLDAKEKLDSGETSVLTPVDDDTMHGYRLLNDVYGKPMLILRIEVPRPIHAQGDSTIVFFLGLGLAALIIFGFGITLLLDQVVIRRFVRLTRDVEQINVEKDITRQVHGGVRDDIGKLADKINQMLAWLSASREAEAKSKREIVALLDQVNHAKERAEEMVVERTRELRDEKARLAASIDSLTFGFVITDMENHILFKNPALEYILELKKAPTSVDDVAGTLGDGFDLKAFIGEARTKAKIVEKRDVSFGKKYLRFLCAPVLTQGSGAETIGFVLVVEDTTDAKNAERSREEFFAIASHELRTPLTGIRWNSEALLKEAGTGDQKAMLQDIYDSSLRLISIVGDFLEVSRLEQGKVEVKSETFDVCEVVAKTIHSLEEMAKNKGLTLTQIPPIQGTNTQVIADRDRVEQVLDNLIGNAIKFTNEGTVTVRTESVPNGVKVSVTDTGIGISEHNQTRLFKKFEQAGENMLARQVNQSTGLGLYISKLITDALHGSIALEESTLGKGSTFSFTLPAAPKPLEDFPI